MYSYEMIGEMRPLSARTVKVCLKCGLPVTCRVADRFEHVCQGTMLPLALFVPVEIVAMNAVIAERQGDHCAIALLKAARSADLKEEVTTYRHTEFCVRALGLAMLSRTLYQWEWPHYCRECNGTGGHTHSHDPSPAGIALSPGTMEEWETCPLCTAHGLCPRCGENIWFGLHDELMEVCEECSFSFVEETPGFPSLSECSCWEAARAEVL